MVKYKIALVNVFWSESENNTRYFINKNEQDLYFDNLANGKLSPFVNFNMGNGIDTTITYKEELNQRSVDEIMKCNYAIVYKYSDETTIAGRRYYFAYPRQDSGGQVIVSLTLDDIQTNFLQKQAMFDRDVIINRANLNRFVWDSETNKFKFNIGSAESPFYQIEDFNETPKRLTKRTSLNLHVDTLSDTSAFNQFFDDNIIGWEYVYLAPKDHNDIDYEAYQLRNDTLDTKWVIDSSPIKSFFHESENNVFGNLTSNGNKCNGAVVCVCAPVYKDNSAYGRSNTINFNAGGYAINVNSYGLEKFLEMNGYYSYVYARKFSIRPPFKPQRINANEYTVVSEYNYMTIDGTLVETGLSSNSYKYIDSLGCHILYTGIIEEADQSNRHMQGCILVSEDYDGLKPYETEEYTIDKDLEFTPSEIVNGSKDDLKFNPKLLSEKFFEVNVTNFSQNFTYDFQKMGNKSIKLKYNEALTPDITKGYARLSGENGLYIDKCEENLTGLVVSNDYSLMVANDKLSEMLANNKNYFLQQALNIGKSAIGGAIGGGFVGIGELAGAIMGAGSGVANMFMNLDNMRNAPAQIKNANGNVYFASDIQPFKLAIEEYEALEYDKKAFNDYCYMFGYKYNRMGLLANFINIRSIFNYIEADLINVSVPMQNEEKRRLIEKFKYGIRFWNTDVPSFSGQNYENNVYQKYQEELTNEQNG